MLTFESEQFQGSSGIIEKLKVSFALFFHVCQVFIAEKLALSTQNLPFQKVQHKITTLDAQPSSPTQASLMVLVTGQSRWTLRANRA